NVPGQSHFCTHQKACARYSLVDLGIDAVAYQLGRSYTDGRMAREYLDTACDHWLTLWARKCLVCPPTDAEEPPGDTIDVTSFSPCQGKTHAECHEQSKRNE